MKTVYSFLVLVLFAVPILVPTCCGADTVRRDAPSVYTEYMEPELTAVEPLMDQVDYFDPGESDHGRILQENIVYITSDGRRFEVFHSAYKALSNGDLDGIGSDLFTYRPEIDTIYLIRAETILPDGSICPVPEEGSLLQAHQSEQKSMIFSGRKQLRLIYPQVSKGAVTHYIVLIERREARMPGQYMDRHSWERSWQTHHKRVVVNLPESYAERLNTVALGTGIPDVNKTRLENGRTRYEWVREKLPVRKSEYLDGPIIQTGPVFFLSTLKDWQEFSAWYAPRIRESSELNEALKRTAREWAGDAQTEDEIIRNLAFRAANDIRYVSLEFGVGGLQPQPASSVLDNRFGDCKDKANFLRVLLQEHGIESKVALINTRHAGRVEKRCADFGSFNHAILLIEKSNGERVFCDPTLKYGTAGMLSPRSSDRPVLVIDDEASTCSWVQTPTVDAGHLDYDFDLSLAQNGELAGWMTLKADGYYAGSLSRRFEATDRASLKYKVKRYLEYFYSAVSVMDYEIKQADADEQEFYLKAYFIRPATGEAGLAVSWPKAKWLLPRLGDEKHVHREAFVWNDEVRLRLKMALPDSISADNLPAEWNVHCRGFQAAGRWSLNEHQLTAELDAAVPSPRVLPPDFPRMYTAVDATCHWLEEPVILKIGAESSTAPVAEQSMLRLGKEFVLMSSGEGQLELIDHLYPSNTKAAERRLALEQTKSWFPKEQKTLFECDMRLGWLAYSEKEYEQSAAAARQACKEYESVINHSSMGWALYLEAMSIEELGDKAESLRIFRELADDPQMNDYRRGYASYQYARMMAEDEPDTALEYYLKALRFPTGSEKWMLQNSYRFLLERMDEAPLVSFLQTLHAKQPEKAKSLLIWLGEICVENAPKLLGMVHVHKAAKVFDQLDFADQALESSLRDKLRSRRQEFEGYEQARDLIRAHLEAEAYAFWQAEPDQERNFDEYVNDIKQAVEDDEVERASRLALWRILYLEPEVEFPAWIWDAARMIDYLYKNDHRNLEPLLVQLFDVRPHLPAEAAGTIDLLFLKAESREREGFADDALAVYQALHDQQLKTEWLNSLYSRWTDLLVSEGRTGEALSVYEEILGRLEEDEDFLALALKGVYLLLQSGENDRALEWIHRLDAECRRLEWKGELINHLNGWSALEDAGLLRKYWAWTESWLPRWQTVQAATGLPAAERSQPAAFSDMEALGEEVGQALAAEDSVEVGRLMERLMNGARWHPAICLEAQSMLTMLVEHYPDAADALYRFSTTLNSAPYQLDVELRQATRLRALGAMLNHDLNEELFALAEACYTDSLPDEDRGMYARYGGLAAVRLGRTETSWIGRMEDELKEDENRFDPYAVNILSLLYRQENASAQEQALLEAFLDGYDGENADMKEMLEQRLSGLLELADGNTRLTQAVKAWSGRYAPAWLEFFPNPALHEEDVAFVAEEIKTFLDQDEELTYARAAFLYHAALDERLDSATRGDALFGFIREALGPDWLMHRNLEMLQTIAEDDRFPEKVRGVSAVLCINIAMCEHVPGYLDETHLEALSGLGIHEELEEEKEQLIALCRLNPFSAEEISGWMDDVITRKQPLSRRYVFLLGQCFKDLCGLGAVELAEHQISNIKALRFQSSANTSALALQLSWGQQLERVKDLMPIHEMMQSFYRKQVPKPAEAPDLKALRFTRLRDPKELQVYCRGMLHEGCYDHSRLSFWSMLDTVEYLNGAVRMDASSLETVLAEFSSICRSDRQFDEAVQMILKLIDVDDPACRKVFSEWSDELSRRPDLRETHLVLAWRRYHERVRTGNHGRLLADLRQEKSLSKQKHHELMMTVLLLGDQQAMNDYLNTVSPELLLEKGQMVDTLAAYVLCGREAELKLFREKGMETLKECMAKALYSDSMVSIRDAFDLAELLQAGELLDRHWMEQVEQTARKDNLAYLKMRMACAAEDWAAAETAARALLKYEPTHYDNYYFLGKALIRQKKYADGTAAMEPFLKYCRDSRRYGEAQRLSEDACTALQQDAG